jgi:hypothetical protein
MAILGTIALIVLVILGVMVLRVKSDPLEKQSVRKYVVASTDTTGEFLDGSAAADCDNPVPRHSTDAPVIPMWHVGFRLFLGMLTTAIFTNAVAVYLLHDVDIDRIGRLNLAYRELTLESLIFAIVATAIFLLAGWIGSLVLRLRVASSGLRLGFVLGIALMLIQYPGELIVRKFSSQHSADSFLLAYLLLAPMCCAGIIILDCHRRRSDDRTSALHC